MTIARTPKPAHRPVNSTATLSGCGRYRYLLGRRWAPGPTMGWIMLNPSTADATHDDNTIRACVRLARAAGAGGILVANLYALRSTDPKGLRRAADPIGPVNDNALARVAAECDPVVCAWGAHADLGRKGRGAEVLGRLELLGVRPVCLAVLKGGEPGHPLFVRTDTPLRPYGRAPR
jgi:hypothetical protein